MEAISSSQRRIQMRVHRDVISHRSIVCCCEAFSTPPMLFVSFKYQIKDSFVFVFLSSRVLTHDAYGRHRNLHTQSRVDFRVACRLSLEHRRTMTMILDEIDGAAECREWETEKAKCQQEISSSSSSYEPFGIVLFMSFILVVLTVGD